MNTCIHCGTVMTTHSPEGLCPRCLLSVAIKGDSLATVDSAATQPAVVGGSAPVASIDIGDAGEVANRLPQFEILKLLGRGGMGVVYKARQIQLDRIVALKILPPADAASSGFVERFRREARSLAKLSHPNIVSVYDFGETNGLYYFVMEFVDGLNLRQMILAHRMTPAEALSVVPKICDALQFAHEEGIVHRDIKPENILLDKRGRLKIADFGLAKLLGRAETDPRLTMSGATLGTPRYMAPEQMDKPETVDHRADIYSLGVVFYEMLTGELPMGRFAPPSQKVQIDVRLDEIVLHALERDVELRYQHASQVRDDVEHVTNSKPAMDASLPRGVSPLPVVEYAPAQPGFRSRLSGFFVRDPERWWVIGSSVVLYITSLLLPAARFGGMSSMRGSACFSWVLSSNQPIWLANPVLWVGWLLLFLHRRWSALLAGAIAFALCIWVLIDPRVISPSISIGQGPLIPMGAPHLLTGYACWLASAGIFAVGALFLAVRGRRPSAAQNQPDTMTPPPRQSLAPAKTWLGVISLCAAVAGLIVPVALMVTTLLIGQVSINVPTQNGPMIVFISLALGVLLEIIALGCGIAAWRTTPGKAGMIISGAVLSLCLLFGLYVTLAMPRTSPRLSSPAVIDAKGPAPETIADSSPLIVAPLSLAPGPANLRCTLKHGSSVFSIAFSPNGQALATGSDAARLWSVATGAQTGSLPGDANGGNIVAFSPNGRILATDGGNGNNDVILWDVTGAARILGRLRGPNDVIRTLAFSPDGTLLASGSDQAVRLWDVATGNVKFDLVGHTGLIWSVAFSPDGKTLASGSDDHTIKLWDIATGNKKLTIHALNRIESVAFNPDGKTLASGSSRVIEIWDVATGQATASFQADDFEVRSVAFNGDGTLLASGSGGSDTAIKLWDATSHKLVTTLTGHTGPTVALAFSPDGKTLASASWDKTARLWNVGIAQKADK